MLIYFDEKYRKETKLYEQIFRFNFLTKLFFFNKNSISLLLNVNMGNNMTI
jgi:hypothetical protein